MTPKTDQAAALMDITAGFQIEVPEVFARWGMSQTELKQAFAGQTLQRVGNDRFSIFCTSLGSLEREVGFEFRRSMPFAGFSLRGIRIVSKPHVGDWLEQHLAASYAESLRHLVATFGSPTWIGPDDWGTEEYETRIWKFPGVEVTHGVTNRFIPSESITFTHR